MTNKVILITGTSKGIGKYLVEYYCNKNANNIVIGCSRNSTSLNFPNYYHYQIDITNEQSIINMIKEVKINHKKIDCLINNAAVNPSIITAALLKTENIYNSFQTNVFAPMIFCREVLKLMIRNKFGRIINIGSMATKHEVTGEALYTSSKAAIIAYSRVLAKEVAKANITVNVVAPSAIHTDLSSQINQVALHEVLSRNAIHSYGEMKDVTNVIDLLMKDESQSITGQVIYLGGV
jgi:3-oxoacyl-[acyl-carrier protein] reductase